jgi:tetratricopeptide (TPR) repeat protein
VNSVQRSSKIGPGKRIFAWLLVILLAGAAAAAAIAHELSTTLAAMIVAVAAAAGVVVPWILASLQRQEDASLDRRRDEKEAEARLKRKADERLRRVRALALDWPLSFGDVQPEDLGVTPSAKAQSYAKNDDKTGYVRRDIDDDDLISAFSAHRFIVVAGPSKAGKSRTAFEVASEAFAEDLLLVPALRPEDAPEALRELFGELDVMADAHRRVVVWLDDIQRYVRFRALDASLLRKWRTHDPPVVIVATIRDTELAKLQEDERTVLSRAKRVTLPARLSDAELVRAAEIYPGEDFTRGIGVQMVDAPRLIETFELAATSQPQAYALISAAVDWQRATSNESISADELFELARLQDYRHSAGDGTLFRDADLERALRWSLTRLPSGVSLLYESDDKGERFSVFDYLIDYAGGRVEEHRGRRAVPPGIWEAALSRLDAADCAAVGFSAQYFQAWDVARRAWTKAQEDDESACEAGVFLGILQNQLGESVVAKETLEAALVNDTSTHPLDALTRTVGLANLAVAQMNRGEMGEASDTAARAVATAEEEGSNPAALAAALNAQGVVSLTSRQPGALQLVERSANLIDENFADNDLLLGESLLMLSRALASEGSLASAEEAAERALAVYDGAVGLDTIWGATVLVARGNVRRLRGSYEDAVSDLERARAIQEAVWDGEHPNIGLTMQLLGRCELALGDLPTARASVERSVRLLENAFSPNNPECIASLHLLGVIKQELGDYAAAKSDLQRAVQLEEVAEDAEHLTLSYMLHDLGRAERGLGELSTARGSFERALAIKEKTLESGDEQIAVTLYQLAEVRYELGEYAQSGAEYQRTLAIEEANLGGRDISVAYTLHMLGSVQRALGELSSAKTNTRRALAIKEEILGPDDIQVAYSLDLLALLDRDLDELAEAKTALGRALAIKESAPEHGGFGVGLTLSFRGSVNLKLAEISQAEDDLDRAVELLVEANGDTDSNLFRPLQDRATLFAAGGQPDRAKEYWEWAIAARRFDAEDSAAGSILEALKPIVAGREPEALPGIANAPPPLESMLAEQRRQVFECRRRIVEGVDVRALLGPSLEAILDKLLTTHLDGVVWDISALEERLAKMSLRDAVPREELAAYDRRSMIGAVQAGLARRWDLREAELGEGLVRALERFLLAQVLDKSWAEYRGAAAQCVRDHGDGNGDGIAARLDTELCDAVWGAFFGLLFSVQVSVEDSARKAPSPPRTYVQPGTWTGTTKRPPEAQISSRSRLR